MSDPVQIIPADQETAAPEPGVGLCLSGGGYRAMVFHAGVLWRLYEAGLLRNSNRISSVSGGSITAALLALKWKHLSFDACAHPIRLRPALHYPDSAPLRARRSMRKPSFWASLLPGRISDRVASAYEEHLFGNATLQDLPDEPRFVINATNVQSGALWRFMKPYMRDYRVGSVPNPKVPSRAGSRCLVRVPSGAFPHGDAPQSERFHAELRLGSAAQAFHQ